LKNHALGINAILSYSALSTYLIKDISYLIALKALQVVFAKLIR